MAILFWFYKNCDVCVDRVRQLRMTNPTESIFGLYGGPPDQTDSFRDALSHWLDDYYAYPESRPADWKWQHGDELIVRWFADRGETLDWDRLFVAQWDLVVTKGVQEVLGPLGPNELFLSGLRPMEEVVHDWWWSRPDGPFGEQYQQFVDRARIDLRYSGEPQACQFIVASIPRDFIVQYARIHSSFDGFLEYKIPILASALGFKILDKDPYNRCWPDQRGPFTAISPMGYAKNVSIRSYVIAFHLCRPRGARVFHPVEASWPKSSMEWIGRITKDLSVDLSRFLWKGARRIARRIARWGAT